MKFLASISLLLSFSCLAQVQTIKIGDFDIEYELSGSGKHLVLLEAGMTRDLYIKNGTSNTLFKSW